MSVVVAVTGANGFIASHVVRVLLEKGYTVRGAVRAPDSDRCAHLKALPGAATRLKLFASSLTDDGSYDECIQGCAGVFHMASPLFIPQPGQDVDGERDFILPAVRGTDNVLASCQRAGTVKHVVVTSSMAAINPQPAPAIKSESDWSDPDRQKESGNWYGASKTLAEKAAWAFHKKMTTDRFKLSTVCPTMVFGPMLQPGVNATMGRLLAVCKGDWPKQLPNDSMSLVDVRDVAGHHVAAFETAQEGRFISVAGESWHWADILAAVKAQHPPTPEPTPMNPATPRAQVTKFDLTRMHGLGVPMRPMQEVIADAVAVLKQTGNL